MFRSLVKKAIFLGSVAKEFGFIAKEFGAWPRELIALRKERKASLPRIEAEIFKEIQSAIYKSGVYESCLKEFNIEAIYAAHRVAQYEAKYAISSARDKADENRAMGLEYGPN